MISLIFGDEPYLIDKAIKETTKDLDDMNIVEFEKLDSEVVLRASQYPFFSKRQALIVRTQSLGTLSSDIIQYLDKPETFTDLIIIPDELDKRTVAFMEFKKRKLINEKNKLNEKQLQSFCLRILESMEKKIKHEVYGYFVERCGYFEDSNVTLYTVKIYLEQMSFYDGDEITVEKIDAVVDKSINQKTFVLSGLLLSNKNEELFTLANFFLEEGENVIGMLSLMMRVFRLAYKSTLYKEKSPSEIGQLIGVPTYQFKDAMKYSPDVISAALDIFQQGVTDIKKGRASSRMVFIKCLGEAIQVLGKQQ